MRPGRTGGETGIPSGTECSLVGEPKCGRNSRPRLRATVQLGGPIWRSVPRSAGRGSRAGGEKSFVVPVGPDRGGEDQAGSGPELAPYVEATPERRRVKTEALRAGRSSSLWLVLRFIVSRRSCRRLGHPMPFLRYFSYDGDACVCGDGLFRDDGFPAGLLSHVAKYVLRRARPRGRTRTPARVLPWADSSCATGGVVGELRDMTVHACCGPIGGRACSSRRDGLQPVVG